VEASFNRAFQKRLSVATAMSDKVGGVDADDTSHPRLPVGPDDGNGGATRHLRIRARGVTGRVAEAASS
jgi:hypothetical protein